MGVPHRTHIRLAPEGPDYDGPARSTRNRRGRRRPWHWPLSRPASASAATSRRRGPTRTTRWTGIGATLASRTSVTDRSPSSSSGSSSRPPGRRTPRTSSPRSTSGARRAPPSGSRRCARSSTAWPTRSRAGASKAATSSTTTRPRPSATSSSTCSSPRRRRSTRRCGSTSASRACPSRPRPASSCPSRTRWTRSSTGTSRRARSSRAARARASTCPASDPRPSCSRAAAPRPGRSASCAGADASAGTIKSGGKTRRAAKMVILDVGHPDVEEFIWVKAREEQKIRVLEQAGFDMSLDGRDMASVQYQNANNSVRVTDEFMQAVVDDADWHLRAVTNGEIVRTIRARDLMRQIAQAAWECADPGMQFDTTINRWHTAAATGRINASNPCSEYMHLDDSACNLASINLLRFLGPDDSFDIAGYKQAVEVMFTGQEILVGRADYPTPGDRRHLPALPPARAGLRQHRRAADGPGPALRLRRRPGLGRGAHRPHDRPRLRHLRPHRGPHGPVRGLRGQRRAHAPRARHAPGRGGPRGRGARPGRPARRRAAGVGRRVRPRRAVRGAQLAGHRPRAHRHDRADDGLRHHRASSPTSGCAR